MARGRYYVDTSAYLCLLLGEAGCQRVAAELDGGDLVSSVLLGLEAERTLIQLSRTGRLSPADLQASLDRLAADLDQFALRDLTLANCPVVPSAAGADPLRESGGAPEPGGPGTRPARPHADVLTTASTSAGSGVG